MPCCSENGCQRFNLVCSILMFAGSHCLISFSYVDVQNSIQHRKQIMKTPLEQQNCADLCPSYPFPEEISCCNSEKKCQAKAYCLAQKISEIDDETDNSFNDAFFGWIPVVTFSVLLAMQILLEWIKRKSLMLQRQIQQNEARQRLIGNDQEVGEAGQDRGHGAEQAQINGLLQFLIQRGILQVVRREERGDPNIAESEVADEQTANEMCSICYDPLSRRNIIRLPNCRHMFHSNCIRRWCIEHPTCPVCRQPIYRPLEVQEGQQQ